MAFVTVPRMWRKKICVDVVVGEKWKLLMAWSPDGCWTNFQR